MQIYKDIYEDDNEDSDFTDVFNNNNNDYYEGENYGERKYERKTALFLAVEKKNPEIVENESIDPNKINIIRDQNLQETFGNDDYYSITELYYAIDDEPYNYDPSYAGSNVEIIKLWLTNEKIDPNIINYIKKRDYEGGDCFIKKETAFFSAIKKKEVFMLSD